MGDLKTFLYEGETKDKYSFAIGGFADDNFELPSGFLSDIYFGSFKDPVAVDVRLYNIIKEGIEPFTDAIKVLGASIRIDDTNEACGALLGRLDSNEESAFGRLSKLYDDLFEISFPGKFGVSFKGSMMEADEIAAKLTIIADQITHINVNHINDITNLMNKEADIWMMVSDGSGNSVGSVFVSEKGLTKKSIIKESF